MRCPHCGYSQSRVLETRDADEAVRRRRECLGCQLRFTTYEQPQFPKLQVRGASGRQRSFTRPWLITALRAAGSALPDAALKTASAAIEAQLRAAGRRVVTTQDVAAVALREIAQRSTVREAAGSVSADQVTAALEAGLPAAPPRSAQLPLPIGR